MVIADSVPHVRRATVEELTTWAAGASGAVLRALATTDAAEPGVESTVRIRLRRWRVGVRTQVSIESFRVDLLVGDRLVIECDGGDHHASWAARAADRARDRRLAVLGDVVVRLTDRQVVDDWERVEAGLLDLVRRRAHRAPRAR